MENSSASSAGIEPANFEKFFATLALGPDATVAMHHRDGTLLARYPHIDAMIGKNFNSPANVRQVFELARSLIAPDQSNRRQRPTDLFTHWAGFHRDRGDHEDIGGAGRLA